jgi:hypothetical protein
MAESPASRRPTEVAGIAAFDWRPGERIDGPTTSRAQAEADLKSTRQALRAAREWLARAERQPRPPAGIVDRGLLAAKLALDDLTEHERHRREAEVREMGNLNG